VGYSLPQSPHRRAGLESALRVFLAGLPNTGVRKVILFGSLARGDVGSRSDLDLIVLRESAEPFVRQGEDLLGLFPPGTPVDLLVYTPDEWQALTAGNAFWSTVQKEGIVVYEA
jgi:predicted nucleotidyltransferase